MCIKWFSTDILFSEIWNSQYSLLDMILLTEYLLIKYYCHFFILRRCEWDIALFLSFVFIQSHIFVLKGFQLLWILRQNRWVYGENSKIFFWCFHRTRWKPWWNRYPNVAFTFICISCKPMFICLRFTLNNLIRFDRNGGTIGGFSFS